MTPKEKAEELFDKFKDLTLNVEYDDEQNNFTAKGCALIAVDEMLDFRNALYINEGSLAHDYLLKVKQEIENL